MSTKIYDGVRFHADSLEELVGQLNGWWSEFDELVVAAATHYVATQIVQTADKACLKGEEIPRLSLREFQKDLKDRQFAILRDQHRDPHVDYEFSVLIIPWKGMLVGRVITEQSAWADAFKRRYAGVVSDFSFWDNNDPDSTVSSDEWALRENTWNEIVAKNSRIGRLGVTLDFYNSAFDLPWVHRSKVLEVLNGFSLDGRAMFRAKTVVMDERLQVYPQNHRDAKAIAFYHDIIDWMKTPDGRAALSRKTKEIKPKLISPFTEEMISY